MSDWIEVAGVDEFGPGETRLVDVDDVLIAVFNLDGEYFAMENTCTHDGFPLLNGTGDPGTRITGGEITCPRHGARFCIRTGDALCPPAYEPVAVFPTRVAGGTVQVRDDRWD